MMETSMDLTLLSPYEEAIGPLNEILEDGGAIIAKVGKIALLLPGELKAPLTECLGKRVGILRTDDLHRPYRWRVVN